MKVRENHVSLPPLDYKKAKEIVQKECDDAYNRIVLFNHPFWNTLQYIAPCRCTKCYLNPD